jgi:hypothetical protein
MDLSKVLLLLHEELTNLNAAIVSLERLQERAKGRGRHPAWLAAEKRSERTRRKSPEEDTVHPLSRK